MATDSIDNVVEILCSRNVFLYNDFLKYLLFWFTIVVKCIIQGCEKLHSYKVRISQAFKVWHRIQLIMLWKYYVAEMCFLATLADLVAAQSLATNLMNFGHLKFIKENWQPELF